MKNSKLKRLTIFGVEQTFKSKFWIILNIITLVAAIVYVNFGTVKEIIELKSGSDEKDSFKIMIVDETNKFEEYITAEKDDKIVIKEYTEKRSGRW